MGYTRGDRIWFNKRYKQRGSDNIYYVGKIETNPFQIAGTWTIDSKMDSGRFQTTSQEVEMLEVV
jgi:hypothetical protein